MSPNKARERQIVEGVIRTGLLPQGELYESESAEEDKKPDLTLMSSNGEIGVEVTEYHTSTKERENMARFNSSLLPKMLERLREVGGHDYDYLRGTIYPREEEYFPSPQMEDKFAEALVNVIVNDENINNTKKSTNRKRMEINNFSEYHLLHKRVSRIICHWTEYVDEPSWEWGPFTVRFVGLTPEKLEEILSAKKEQAERYRKESPNKLVLVIHSGQHLVSEFGSPQHAIAQLQRPCKKELENSGFDEVILYSFACRGGGILYNNAETQDATCQ